MIGQDDLFLNVDCSVKGRRWVARLKDERLGLALAQRSNLPEIVGRILAARDVNLESVEDYLNPTLRTLMPQPGALRDLEKGAAIIAQAIINNETIGIIGDYDVDGVSSCALFQLYLEALGRKAHIHIPDRLQEGYGPSLLAVKMLKKAECRLILTLDCGSVAHEPLAEAARLGLNVVIIDHHQTEADLPIAQAIINPNRHDDVSGFGYLCAAGVAFIVLGVINRTLRLAGWFGPDQREPDLLQWLQLVALATVCDVVPLRGLNRAFVRQGLKIMGSQMHMGIVALAQTARVKQRPDVYTLGFLLGPRINAAGRIGHADLALELLTTQERGRAMEISQKLEQLNRERQLIELSVVDACLLRAEKVLAAAPDSPVLVLSGENWHPGIVGLAAARLKERFNLPSFVLSQNNKANLAQGSGRSIPGVDLGEMVRKAHLAGLVVKGGGHAMAAGLTVSIERLKDLTAFFVQEIKPLIGQVQQNFLAIDGALTASGATLELIDHLEMAGPYGSANPAPLFAFPAHYIVYADAVGADHVRCTLAASDGTRLKAIAFRAVGTELGELLLSERQFPIHIVGRLTRDEWGARRAAAVHIEDAARISTLT